MIGGGGVVVVELGVVGVVGDVEVLVDDVEVLVDVATRTAGKNPVRAFIIHSQFDQNLGLDIVVSKDTSH